jgi:NAD(P)-dependent dehydrogenase (short-subunit alcohol dehydrogenase family)
MILMPLKDKVAVVTGATGELGRVVTKILLESGAYVVSTYRNEGNQIELSEFLGELKDNLIGVEADVTSETSVQNLFQKAIEKHGRIDILLNIVGAYSGGDEIVDTKENDWDSMMNVNLKSVFLCSKAALAFMIKQNYGKIVSVAARPAVEKRWRVKSGAYAISKAGVVALTETIAEEVKKYDINVNCVMPSTIDTPDNRRNFPNSDFSKWVNPEDVAKVILFLVSDDSRVTSGASIPVYGKA